MIDYLRVKLIIKLKKKKIYKKIFYNIYIKKKKIIN